MHIAISFIAATIGVIVYGFGQKFFGFPAYLTMKQASNYAKRELLRAYDVLLKADEDLKSTGSSDEFVLYRTLEEIIVGERRMRAAPVAETA